MVSINYAFKEIFSKIVYYGPGLSGKTTNLQYVFKKVPKDTRGELISLATDADRTLYFDFLPVNVGKIRGFSVKFQLYTVPGQVYYNATRKLVLRGVDGLVFVADSQIEKMDDNVESLRNLEENLAEYGYNIEEMPLVMQYNKRDLPNIATIEQLNEVLNPRGIPYFEAIASEGDGVFATLKAISKLVIDTAKKGGMEKPKTATSMPADVPAEELKPHPKEPVAVASSQSSEKAISVPLDESTKHTQEMTPEVEYSDTNEQPVMRSQKIQMQDSSYGSPAEPSSPDTESPAPEEKPAIVTESENLTNVVVSTSEHEAEQEIADEPVTEDLEETTEHSVLKEDSEKPVEHVESDARRINHPDVLDADKIDDVYLSKKSDEAKYPEMEPSLQGNFDEEATVITDPHQTGHLLSKPQMAESKKVKGKKKAGLFSWLRKSKKNNIKEG